MSNVLIVAPHPDDETLGCGGTILKHTANKDKVSWLIMTQLSVDQGYKAADIKERDAIDLICNKGGLRTILMTPKN